MKNSVKWTALALAAVIAAGLLSACHQKSVPASRQGASSRGSGSSQTRIVGKVTSIIGNQVTLAVGTWNSDSSDGESRGTYSASSDVSSRSASSASGGSSGFTPSGETQSVLIPVGLTLSSGNSGKKTSQSSGNSGGGTSDGAAGGSFSGGGQSGSAGGQTRTGGSNGGSRSSSAGTTGTTGTLGNLQRSKDFSSITKGMILRIVQAKLSDGTQGVTQVQILSE